MPDAAAIEDTLKRVEQMLDALEASDQSSAHFRAGCDQLENYLGDQKTLLAAGGALTCLLYTSPSPRDMRRSRMPSSA